LGDAEDAVTGMKQITSNLIDELIVRAGANARQRINYNIHESLSDPVQRLFIASALESYFRPHRHPEKWEFVLVIRGLFDVIVFDDAGRVIERASIGPGEDIIGFEI
jgi:cupin fold WbuC family metalloprotein